MTGNKNWSACQRLYPDFPSDQACTIFPGCDPKYVRRSVSRFDRACLAKSIILPIDDDRGTRQVLGLTLLREVRHNRAFKYDRVSLEFDHAVLVALGFAHFADRQEATRFVQTR